MADDIDKSQTDLFGDPARIEIRDNDLLARTANHVRDVVSRNAWLTEGDTIGEIEKKIVVAIWLDDGLRATIPNEDQRATVTAWLISKQCLDSEIIRRACRYLREHDQLRFSQKAILAGERHRERIARSVKH
jgi:hypothetical protein